MKRRRLYWLGFALSMSLCVFSAVGVVNFFYHLVGIATVKKVEKPPDVMNNPLYVPPTK